MTIAKNLILLYIEDGKKDIFLDRNVLQQKYIDEKRNEPRYDASKVPTFEVHHQRHERYESFQTIEDTLCVRDIVLLKRSVKQR